MSQEKAASPGQSTASRAVACDLVLHPIAELVTPYATDIPARRKQMHEIRRISNAAIGVAAGKIVYVGSADEMKSHVSTNSQTKFIDCSTNLVSPGLVDPHTHLIFGGNRCNEFIMRCQGKSYAEIAEAGGGIVASMKATQSATRAQLRDLGRERLKRMVEYGTTTVEIKTGYGLSTESELNMLECIYDLKDEGLADVVPTFMPAHAVPPGADKSVYVEEIIRDMLPRASQIWSERSGNNGGDARPLYVDVFCDRGYFTLEDSRRIFDACKKLPGLKTKIHSDEFVNCGATTLAIESGSASADHLLNITVAEIELMSKSETVAVLLPGTSFYLNLGEHAPARMMIEKGAAVALGSDFNPGSCHIFSLPMILALACLHLKMTAQEALTALTLNSACALGLGREIGVLHEGYRADITIYDVATLEEIPYNIGWNPVKSVIRNGALVVADKKLYS